MTARSWIVVVLAALLLLALIAFARGPSRVEAPLRSGSALSAEVSSA